MAPRKINPILDILKSSLVSMPVPSNLSLMWNYGSLLGVCLMIQIVSGVVLAMHYTPHIDLV